MTEIIICLAIVFLFASSEILITRTYNKYKREDANLPMTGKEVVERMLAENGVTNVVIGTVKGELTDHYNSRTKVIRLSKESYQTNSIAAIAVAAHETGHALQDNKGYLMLKVRNFIAPICSFGARFFWIVLIIGIILGSLNLILLGIAFIGSSLLFQLATLPVELNASRRAVAFLDTLGYDEDTMYGARKVLKAAAFTYIASTLAAALQILRLVLSISRD